MSDRQCDVIVVGAGPVGLALGRMLGLAGHEVVILERWADWYPLPRAVHFDDEIGRIFQSMGLTDEIKAISEGVPDFYEWRNAAGETLLRIDWSGTGPSGWPTANFFSQPQLEQVLAAAVGEMRNVTLLRDADVVDLSDLGDHVEVRYRSASNEDELVYGSFAVGCDGANSFVRQCMGAVMHDEGFVFDWLIVDTIPLDAREWSPQNWQLCDPARPTTVVSGGPGRRRWEFMRLPGESRDELNTLDMAWKLLEVWDRTPHNTQLERHAVYTFAARWADRWNEGRLAIAGDAAHQMPPFAGQGMCSGLRDAQNLSWKLDRILHGVSDLSLLNTYTSERSVHIQHAIAMSVELGRVICVLDEDQADVRDTRMIAAGADPARVLPVAALPVLGPGVTAQGCGIAALRGTLAPQFPVQRGGRVGLLDDIIGPGAFLLVRGEPPSGSQLDALPLNGTDLSIVSIATVGSPELLDTTGLWMQWFDAHGVEAVLLRPDRYIFGAITSGEDLGNLIAQYGVKICTAALKGGAMSASAMFSP